MTHPCPTLRSADLSPTANQSTPRRSRHASASPPGHAPDFRNCTTATCQSRATPRLTTPKADDDFPLPSPVFTTTTLFCLRTGGVWCSVGISDDAVTGRSLVADGEAEGAYAVGGDAALGAVVDEQGRAVGGGRVST